MTKVYNQHEAAFSNVSAYVVLKDGGLVAKVAFKFPKDGAGRLYAYVHFLGLEMVRDYAGGYGYDKRSAAVEHATRKIPEYGKSDVYGNNWEKEHNTCEAFKSAIANMGGQHWHDALIDAGFTVIQAV